jgi:hypothetical protein
MSQYTEKDIQKIMIENKERIQLVDNNNNNKNAEYLYKGITGKPLISFYNGSKQYSASDILKLIANGEVQIKGGKSRRRRRRNRSTKRRQRKSRKMFSFI